MDQALLKRWVKVNAHVLRPGEAFLTAGGLRKMTDKKLGQRGIECDFIDLTNPLSPMVRKSILSLRSAFWLDLRDEFLNVDESHVYVVDNKYPQGGLLRNDNLDEGKAGKFTIDGDKYNWAEPPYNHFFTFAMTAMMTSFDGTWKIEPMVYLFNVHTKERRELENSTQLPASFVISFGHGIIKYDTTKQPSDLESLQESLYAYPDPEPPSQRPQSPTPGVSEPTYLSPRSSPALAGSPTPESITKRAASATKSKKWLWATLGAVVTVAGLTGAGYGVYKVIQRNRDTERRNRRLA